MARATFEHNPNLTPRAAEDNIRKRYLENPFRFTIEILPITISPDLAQDTQFALINIIMRYLYDDLDNSVFDSTQRT